MVGNCTIVAPPPQLCERPSPILAEGFWLGVIPTRTALVHIRCIGHSALSVDTVDTVDTVLSHKSDVLDTVPQSQCPIHSPPPNPPILRVEKYIF